MPDTNRPLGTITVRHEERILPPPRFNAFARRTQLTVTAAVIVAVYVALLGALLWRDAADPPRAAQVEETPVEVVAALPPTPPAPAPNAEIEKPATSAPRAVNDSDAEDQTDKATSAPRAATAKPAAPPATAAETAPQPDSAADHPDPAKDEAKADTPKPPDVLAKDAEALDRLPPEPPRRPADHAAAKPVPKPPRRPPSVAQQLAGAAELPNYTFAKPMRKRAKVSGGTEDDRYLAVVYGMITQNRRAIRAPDTEWSVAVSFVVDGGGNLVGVQVTKSSGYPEVDAAAVQSVEEAAPFPPPPSGGNTGLVARLRSLDSQAMAGDR